MASDKWTIEDPIPKSETYEWQIPNEGQQDVEQTIPPGDLLIKPRDVDSVPTLSPKRSGIQHGADDWNFTNEPDSDWYIFGFVED